MKKFIHIDDKVHTFELYGTSDADPDNIQAFVCIDNWFFHWLKVYFRHERTWDDHMGNTPCGSYVNAPFPGGKRRRIYLYK